MFQRHTYLTAIKNAGKEIERILRSGSLRGVEEIIRDKFFDALQVPEERKQKEVPLELVNSAQLWGGSHGRIDIIVERHGIELKVVRLPRQKSGASQSLYDLGQLSSDYARLDRAKKLKSGELLILLYGPLVKDISGNVTLIREFHNRLFVDFCTSLKFGELKKPYDKKWRKEQIKYIKKMHLDQPFNSKSTSMKIYRTESDSSLALVSIPIS